MSYIPHFCFAGIEGMSEEQGKAKKQQLLRKLAHTTAEVRQLFTEDGISLECL